MIIAVAHSKGGVGKTNIAINLAEEMRPDIIIDLDAHSSILELNQFRTEKLNVQTVEDKTQLIDILKQSEQGKSILIDCGGFDSGLNRIAIAGADIVIVPAQDTTTEVIGLRRFNKILKELSNKTGQKIIGRVLLNKVHPNRKHFKDVEEFISTTTYLERLCGKISLRNDFEIAINDGRGVTAHKQTKYGGGAREIKAIVAELKNLRDTLGIHLKYTTYT